MGRSEQRDQDGERPLGRRRLLGLGGAVSAAAVLTALDGGGARAAAGTATVVRARTGVRAVPVVRPEQAARAAPFGLPWIDFSKTPTRLIHGAKLHHSTVLQSFGFDERRGHLYALQVMQGGVRLRGEPRAYSHAERQRRGDLCLNRLSARGRRLGKMYLTGFGHGGTIGVDPGAGAAQLWTEWDAHPGSGYGRGIARIGYAEGSVLHTDRAAPATFRPKPGTTGNYPAIDLTTRRLLLRYLRKGKPRYALYDLDDFAARRFDPLADFAQPGTELRLPYQGMAVRGAYAYQLLGSAYGPKNPRPSGGNTRLFCIDMRSGEVVQEERILAGASLDPREPEGLAITGSAAEPRLCMGFATGPGRGRAYSIYQWGGR
ncbi:teichoic acid biosynthesis protein C [Streptomyces sp. NPDC050610]|uniref:phage baseplate protein n=1 Tax=Streptomyces sp. NPDC050610 TaxID=3157097 RepID=UPI0034172889